MYYDVTIYTFDEQHTIAKIMVIFVRTIQEIYFQYPSVVIYLHNNSRLPSSYSYGTNVFHKED